MAGNGALDKLEEKVYQEYNRDGAIATIIGIIFIMAGVVVVAWPHPWDGIPSAFTLSEPWSEFLPLTIVMLLLLGLVKVWRRRFTYPRLGYSKFAASRNIPKSMILRYVLAMILFRVVLELSIGFSRHMNPESFPFSLDTSNAMMTLIGTVLMVNMGILAVVLGWTKFLVLAPVMLGLIVLCGFVGFNDGWPVILVGGAVVAVGLERLYRFLKDNPLSTEIHA